MKNLIGISKKETLCGLEKPLKRLNEDEIYTRFDSLNTVKAKAIYLFLLTHGTAQERIFIRPLIDNLRVDKSRLRDGARILRELDMTDKTQISAGLKSVTPYETYDNAKFLNDLILNFK